MADKCVAMQTEGVCDHYLWDSGVVVTFNRETRQWSKQRVLHPSDIPDVPTPNREAAPECHADD